VQEDLWKAARFLNHITSAESSSHIANCYNALKMLTDMSGGLPKSPGPVAMLRLADS
jgi:hypothetical protein